MTSDWSILKGVFATIENQGSKPFWHSSANQVGCLERSYLLWCCCCSYTFLVLQEIWKALLSCVAFPLMDVSTSWNGTPPPPASSRRRRETTARWRTLRLVRHKNTAFYRGGFSLTNISLNKNKHGREGKMIQQQCNGESESVEKRLNHIKGLCCSPVKSLEHEGRDSSRF